ncbi:hypothetical protein ADEAN_001032800 [Angomonas deanei]|uniref:Uncharacterized protein n=1 Tax=Angomonas deanei TaxID=59799 RepID=A0A7G2CSN0_9TRYP|nr:hypothetical protein ADEAN_001032800 [Angomonas deanei]
MIRLSLHDVTIHHKNHSEESALTIDPCPPPGADASSNPKTASKKRIAQDSELWKKIAYRRLQLRHVLLQWVTQYISGTKFKLFFYKNLEFSEEHPSYAAWRRHIRGQHYTCLMDILEKIELEKYVCLSQYYDDMDNMTRLVRSFFRTRSAGDMRIRARALELKENVILTLYKINRRIVRFCEEHKEMVVEAPTATEDKDIVLLPEEEDHSGKKVLKFPPSQTTKKRRRYYGERRRRRRPVKKVKEDETNEKEEEENDNNDDNNSSHSGEEDEEDNESNHETENANTNENNEDENNNNKKDDNAVITVQDVVALLMPFPIDVLEKTVYSHIVSAVDKEREARHHHSNNNNENEDSMTFLHRILKEFCDKK